MLLSILVIFVHALKELVPFGCLILVWNSLALFFCKCPSLGSVVENFACVAVPVKKIKLAKN